MPDLFIDFIAFNIIALPVIAEQIMSPQEILNRNITPIWNF